MDSPAYNISFPQRLRSDCFSHNKGDLFPCCITLKMWLLLEWYRAKWFRYLAKSKSVKLERVRVQFSASSPNCYIVPVSLRPSLYRATSLPLTLDLLVVYPFDSTLEHAKGMLAHCTCGYAPDHDAAFYSKSACGCTEVSKICSLHPGDFKTSSVLPQVFEGVIVPCSW